MQTEVFYNLTNDILFKHVFSHKQLIISLLTAFFHSIGMPKNISEVEIYKDYPMYGKNVLDKVFFGDILVVLDTGEIVSVEMYNQFNKEEYMKSASYLSRLFGNQLKKGDTYINAKKVYSINFITGNYSNENKELVNNYGFVRKVENPNLENEFINMYLVRLDLVSKMVYNKNEDDLIRWLKLMVAKNMEEMENIGKGDDAMEQSVAYVKEFLKENGTTFQDKLIYEKNVSRNEGLAEGREKGEKQGILKTARNLLKMHFSVQDIAEATDLSKEEIEHISNEKE